MLATRNSSDSINGLGTKFQSLFKVIGITGLTFRSHCVVPYSCYNSPINRLIKVQFKRLEEGDKSLARFSGASAWSTTKPCASASTTR